MPPKKAAAKGKADPKAKAKAAAAKEPEKRKAPEEEKVEEPPKKEAKVEAAPKAQAKAIAKEAATVEEDGAEKEKDAPKDARKPFKGPICFEPVDTTLNVVPAMGGKMLMALSEGGMQYLIAGARANMGQKSGRYMFEVKIVEALNPSESAGGGGRARAPTPRQLVRIGFSTAKSSLVLGDSEEHVCFDSEGNFWSGKKKSQVSSRFSRDQVIAVVLNLEEGHPNCNTVSIFCEGLRISEPQPLPESCKGKALYPHIAFRNVTVQVLANREPAKPLPFKCRALGGAAAEDVCVAPKCVPTDGKFEVLFPVAFPDEGTFDWLDSFIEKNPQYVELSDRKILEWAAASGLWKPKATGWKNSNDKPEFNFGLPGMDDFSVRRVLNSIAPVVPRNYVVMEVKSNLCEADRKEVLARFSAPHFKKIANVVMGEPSDEFKKMQLDKLLKEKQDKADVAWKAKKAEETRKKQIEQRQKQLAEQRKKAEELRKKAVEEAKKKAAEAKKEAEAKKKKAELEKKKADVAKKKEAGDDVEALEKEIEEAEAKMEVDEEPAAEEPKEEEKKEEEETKDDAMEEDQETSPPEVELTDEEKKMWFRSAAGGCTDLTASVLNSSFGQFSIPEKSENFDTIRYEWQNAEKSKEYLREWVLEKKRTSRVEDLEPGQWFQEKSKEWQKLHADWSAKQKTFKNSAAQKAKEAAKKKVEKKEGEDDAEDEENQAEDLDIFAVEDVTDVGNGEPLFKEFTFEDWALLQLRMELYLLQKAYSKDVDDADRPGISDAHFAFYYNRYFKKQLTPKHFGVTTPQEVAQLVKDAICWDEASKSLSTPLTEDVEELAHFLKMTEDNRRERQRRIDAGDETARLKFSTMAMQAASTAKATAGGAPAIRPAGTSWAAKGAPKGVSAPTAKGVSAPTFAQAPAFKPPLAGKGAWQPRRL